MIGWRVYDVMRTFDPPGILARDLEVNATRPGADFPMGGEPVIFTYNENEMPRWYD